MAGTGDGCSSVHGLMPGEGQMPSSYCEAQAILARATGFVVPVYVSPGIDAGLAGALIEDTVAGYCGLTDDPSRVCISVDGPGEGATIARRLGLVYGATVVVAPANRGKLEGARNGARSLLARPEIGYVAVVDQDGDHFANELVNLVRAAEHVHRASGIGNILVLGCRSSRHRPMGFLRGEHEELADRMLLDALQYHAAVSGEPLRLEFVTTITELPDFHSGYKLFSRESAVRALLALPELAGQSADCYFRHAVEAVMIVEMIVRGGLLVAVGRSTFNEQPMSTFGQYERCQLVADMIVWPCKRLGVPPSFVEQWLANHIPPLLLGTLAPQGRAELKRISNLVRAAFGLTEPPEAVARLRPLFV
jgi:hypothetical protein